MAIDRILRGARMQGEDSDIVRVKRQVEVGVIL
jgi:hypothetical protein